LLEAMRQLLKLEELDGEIATLDAALATMQEERQVLGQDEVKAAGVVSASQEILETRELDMRRLEGHMLDREAVLERLNERTSQVTSKQAYDALALEMAEAREAKSGFETETLLVMEAIDESSVDLGSAEAAVVALAKRLDGKLLARYDRTGLRRRPAVTVFAGTACPICHTGVPAQRLIEIRRADEIYACADCHRLFLPSHAFDD
jgi:predicted  nucleic acid-binding Zn-ribbon protein